MASKNGLQPSAGNLKSAPQQSESRAQSTPPTDNSLGKPAKPKVVSTSPEGVTQHSDDVVSDANAVTKPPKASRPVASTVRATPMATGTDIRTSMADQCAADAPSPQAPEEVALVANGRRYLTGKSLRVGVRGDTFVVEAALGYDDMCRPSPYQIYVFSQGKQVGTLSPSAMMARSDGAITDFKELDSEHLRIEIVHYKPDDPACCPSSQEQRVVPLNQFGIRQTDTASRRASASASADSPKYDSASSEPSFDCARASNDVEHAICSSPELSLVDSEMGRAYGDLLSKLDPKERADLKSEQREWILRRQEECGGNVFCLNTFLHARLENLRDNTRRSIQK